MNEFIYQKQEEVIVARAIPLLFLFFLLMRSFGLHAEMFQTGAFKTRQGIPQIPYYPRICSAPTKPATLDESNTFNEVVVWLAQDANGSPIICTRQAEDIMYGQEPDEYCSPAKPLSPEKIPAHIPQGSCCWESDEYLLCIQPDNKVLVFKKSST
ncbi:TPA: hypothetical protein DCW54_01230 [Candidatus Dependentiae bacterium]|nr:hypothetical protein [Candidatus Dependentiae bacterium]